jgi:hypothetical protein
MYLYISCTEFEDIPFFVRHFCFYKINIIPNRRGLIALIYLNVWYRSLVIHCDISVVLSIIKFRLGILTNSEKKTFKKYLDS